MTPGAPPPHTHEIIGAISAMVRSVDERASDCNRRWGMNRLPHLVPLEWLARFRKAKQAWQSACFECAGSPKPADLETVERLGTNMLRAFDKLEELAQDDGCFPVPVDQWEFELADGTPVILVRTRAEMSMVDPKGRTLQLWSLEEISDIIAKFPMIASAKESFPGAEVIQMRTSKVVIGALDDAVADIPF